MWQASLLNIYGVLDLENIGSKLCLVFHDTDVSNNPPEYATLDYLVQQQVLLDLEDPSHQVRPVLSGTCKKRA